MVLLELVPCAAIHPSTQSQSDPLLQNQPQAAGQVLVAERRKNSYPPPGLCPLPVNASRFSLAWTVTLPSIQATRSIARLVHTIEGTRSVPRILLHNSTLASRHIMYPQVHHLLGHALVAVYRHPYPLLPSKTASITRNCG